MIAPSASRTANLAAICDAAPINGIQRPFPVISQSTSSASQVSVGIVGDVRESAHRRAVRRSERGSHAHPEQQPAAAPDPRSGTASSPGASLRLAHPSLELGVGQLIGTAPPLSRDPARPGGVSPRENLLHRVVDRCQADTLAHRRRTPRPQQHPRSTRSPRSTLMSDAPSLWSHSCSTMRSPKPPPPSTHS